MRLCSAIVVCRSVCLVSAAQPSRCCAVARQRGTPSQHLAPRTQLPAPSRLCGAPAEPQARHSVCSVFLLRSLCLPAASSVTLCSFPLAAAVERPPVALQSLRSAVAVRWHQLVAATTHTFVLLCSLLFRLQLSLENVYAASLAPCCARAVTRVCCADQLLLRLYELRLQRLAFRERHRASAAPVAPQPRAHEVCLQL